ncbi:HXXEE domain-containing protein [Patescibacteria group bacterium]|nr:HXXEE domain-containing protein [Patescibacteria group bacterium]
MITNKLKYIFALSIPLFIAHGIEEYLTGFYNLDQWDEWIFGLLPFTSIHQAMFATFQVMFWLLLLVSLILLFSERTRLYALGLVGVIYIFELHHLVKALFSGGYYPGLITALLFPIVAFFFWREFIKNKRIVK